jgi:hypothetical protein
MKYLKNKKHWTFRYFYNRTLQLIFETRNPILPWLTPQSIKILNELIKPSDIGYEFGSGRSTIWLSSKLFKLVSIEDNKSWFDKILEIITKNNITNIDYYHKESKSINEIDSPYYKALDNIKDNTIDFILIDGSLRSSLALISCVKLKPGGILVLDNANLYLPHETYSPSSLGKNGTPLGNWKTFYELANKSFRTIWTTNGIWDTAIFIKCC